MLIAAFSLAQILSYPFPSAPVRDAKGTAIAYTLDTQGVRTLWFARAPGYSPVQLFSSNADDGQELSDLAIAGDLAHVVYVRGGDHDANWALPLQPGPNLMPQEPLMQVWSISTGGGAAKLLGDGDAPEISPDGSRVAFTNGGAVMIAPVDGSAPAKRLFFDRGQDSELHWSPDGSALAFVSTRTDHSFIGIYRNDTTPLEFVAPSTSQDFMPRWSPDGASIAFVRIGGDGGAPQNPLNWNPTPWQIWVGDVKTASARMVWASGRGGRDSLPQTGLGPFLEWVAGNRLVFNSEQRNWPHLYVASAFGANDVRLLTPGNYMVENASVAPDLQSVFYAANTGTAAGDDDRRHLFRVDVESGAIAQLASGASSEFTPVALADGTIAFDATTAQVPPLVTLLAGGSQRALDSPPADFPASQLLTPQEVSFRAPDGLLVHGQLFVPRGSGKHPAVIFVHGGPPRQMLLTWHYMDYYSNSYAINQTLANRGFVVLSVNYRLGIGYGHDFNFPARWGPTGASEYQDVVAGARFLQRDPRVDGSAHRNLGRFLRRLSHRARARAQLQPFQNRRRLPRRARLVDGHRQPGLGHNPAAKALRTVRRARADARCLVLLSRFGDRHLEVAGAADPGRRRPQRRVSTDGRPGLPSPQRPRALRGDRDSQRDPRLSSLPIVAGSRRRDRFLPAAEAIWPLK